MAHEIVTPQQPEFEYGIITGSSDCLQEFCERIVAAVASGYKLYGPTAALYWTTREETTDEGVQPVPVILYSQSIVREPAPKPQISQAIQLPGIMKPPGGNLN